MSQNRGQGWGNVRLSLALSSNSDGWERERRCLWYLNETDDRTIVFFIHIVSQASSIAICTSVWSYKLPFEFACRIQDMGGGKQGSFPVADKPLFQSHLTSDVCCADFKASERLSLSLSATESAWNERHCIFSLSCVATHPHSAGSYLFLVSVFFSQKNLFLMCTYLHHHGSPE